LRIIDAGWLQKWLQPSSQSGGWLQVFDNNVRKWRNWQTHQT
jgi:hypothetical protein